MENKMSKRILHTGLACVLAVGLLFGALPTAVYAEDTAPDSMIAESALPAEDTGVPEGDNPSDVTEEPPVAPEEAAAPEEAPLPAEAPVMPEGEPEEPTATLAAEPEDNVAEATPQAEATIGGIKFTTLSGGGAAVTGYDASLPAVVDIPASVTIDGTPYPVTEIGTHAFRGCSSLTKVTISASVETIGGKAFQECTALTELNFAAGSRLETIGSFAFYACTSLAAVTIPSQVTLIERNAFEGCSRMTTLAFAAGSQLKTIGNNAFGGCSRITEVRIPDAVTTIGEDAFIRCSSLTKVTISASVETIGGKAFQECTALTELNFAAGSRLETIGSFAFYACTSLAAVEIPSQVTRIDRNAFEGCSSLRITTFTSAKAPTVGGSAFDRVAEPLYVYHPEHSSYNDTFRGYFPSGTLFNAPPAIPVESVTLNMAAKVLKKNKTVQLKATVTPADATDSTITWVSSKPKVATVSANGKVKAKSNGSTTITASAGNAKATCKITISSKAVSVSKVALSSKSLNLVPGGSYTLSATVSPAKATNKKVSFISSNPAVATVNKKGVVSAVAPGTATVTVISTESGKTKTCAVTVLEGSVESVTLSKAKASVKKGRTVKLKATVLPAQVSTASVAWSSSKKSVATVDKNGKVKGIKKGKAKITAKVGGMKATCTITVK